jgi:hypothetical protein
MQDDVITRLHDLMQPQFGSIFHSGTLPHLRNDNDNISRIILHGSLSNNRCLHP